MTSNQEQAHRRHRTPNAIRNESFPRRFRGLDEDQVYDYLDALADQVHAMTEAHRDVRAENDRLRAEAERLAAALQQARSELSEAEVGDRVNDQIVEMFSQAQLVAEEMVEDVSRESRERLGQAREQERHILEEAMATAEQTRRDAEALIRWASPGGGGRPPKSYNAVGPVIVDGNGSSVDGSAAAAELEQVRSYAKAAQAQMKSLIDAFATQVERYGPLPGEAGHAVPYLDGPSVLDARQIDSSHSNGRDPWGTA